MKATTLAMIIGVATLAGCGMVQMRDPVTGLAAPAGRCGTRDREGMWTRISDVVAADASQPTTNASFACEMAWSIAKQCDDDAEVQSKEIAACRIALREDLEEVKKRLGDPNARSGLDDAARSDVWPRLNASGAPVSTVGGRSFGVSLARFETLNLKDPRDTDLLSKARRFRTSTLRFEADMKRLAKTTSCAEIAELGRAASDMDEFTSARYRSVVEQRRAAEVNTRRAVIHATVSKSFDLERMKTPGEARKEIEAARQTTKELACYDADSAGIAEADVARWSSKLEADVSQEETCRATPACMQRREEDKCRADPACVRRRAAEQAAVRKTSSSAAPQGGGRCAECHRARNACLANVQAGRFLEGAICATPDGAKQCCDINFIQCSNGQCGRATSD